MTDVIQSKPDAQKISDRLKPSNDHSTADTLVTHGTGPTRVVHSVHRSGSAQRHGSPDQGGPDLSGGRR
jgi:hypothetical protein